MTTELIAELIEAVDIRRNFAIISHPDAGKTTLTEKLLLYGGAIHEAGSVKARRHFRLDGDGEAAGDFDHFDGDAVQLQELHDQSVGYAWAQGF
jgi:hypothetical protein